MSAVQEHPILMNAPMVMATLREDAPKTQTRRLFKLPKGISWYEELGGEKAGWTSDDNGPGWFHVEEYRCPYGKPGDLLWVREAWRYCGGKIAPLPQEAVVEYIADGARRTVVLGPNDKTPSHRKQREDEDGDAFREYLTHWWSKKTPAIHMFRWASRITLEITRVRVERLQDISGQDAIAEGAPWLACYGPGCPDGPDGCNARGCLGARDWYRDLWESINGAGSWALNPWVWVIEFKRITPPLRPITTPFISQETT
jgi:hypothetical protein